MPNATLWVSTCPAVEHGRSICPVKLSAAPTGEIHDQPTLPKLDRIERPSRSFRYIKEAD